MSINRTVVVEEQAVAEEQALRVERQAQRPHDATAKPLPNSCVVACPACPPPGIYLPPGWDDAVKDGQKAGRV
ncbi:hypothetical protein FB451DRAFT_1400756 [Mycena latifolia]|nr:hypothetical protein FB451DRAFT_1400756 [Mycena latifolia]